MAHAVGIVARSVFGVIIGPNSGCSGIRKTMTLEKGKKLGPCEILSNIATTDLWGAYDVLPDGDFVMVEPAEWEEKPARIHVVTYRATDLGKDSTP